MKTIWKFPFSIEEFIGLRMPANATLLHVDVQNGTPCLWAVVNPDEPMVLRNLRVIATGQAFAVDYDDEHVATFQSGQFVWHVFDEGDQR